MSVKACYRKVAVCQWVTVLSPDIFTPWKGATLSYHTVPGIHYVQYFLVAVALWVITSTFHLNSQVTRQSPSLWTSRQAAVTGIFPSPSWYMPWFSLRKGRSHCSTICVEVNQPNALALSETEDGFAGIRSREPSPSGATAIHRLDYGTYVSRT